MTIEETFEKRVSVVGILIIVLGDVVLLILTKEYGFTN